jgi:4-hydroxy-2-oxoheptanedioate aldolase
MAAQGLLRERLARGKALRGLFVGLPSPALIEMAGHAGFDFVVIDNEHGPAGLETTEHLLRAAETVGLAAIVRASGVDQREILRTLDLGPSGVQVPQVNTAEQARDLARFTHFPPEGMRGVAFSTRAAGFGFHGGAEYMQRTNRALQVVAHIETAEALTNLDALLAVDGIDVWFIGPTDLSVSLGYPGQPDHPAVRQAIGDALERIQRAGRIAGLMVTSADDWHVYASLGACYITFPITMLIGAAMRQLLDKASMR